MKSVNVIHTLSFYVRFVYIYIYTAVSKLAHFFVSICRIAGKFESH